MILAIDPGADQGWCTLDGELMRCGLGEPPEVPARARVIVERPQVYDRGKQRKRVDPNDLITLAIRVGRVTERYRARGHIVGHVLPTTWKGQVPKDVHHVRIVQSLTPAQAATVFEDLASVTPSLRHNVLDAVGLALWASKTKTWRDLAP